MEEEVEATEEVMEEEEEEVIRLSSTEIVAEMTDQGLAQDSAQVTGLQV